MSESHAIVAVRHILRRVTTDTDFAWHMLMTESLRLCCIAECESRKLELEEFCLKMDNAAQDCMIKRMPRITELEAMRDALMAQVATLKEERDDAIDELNDADDGNDDQEDDETEDAVLDDMIGISGLEDLLNYCRLRNERPTVEAVEAAMRGEGIARCLSLMESVVV
jgi:hypothetical protein